MKKFKTIKLAVLVLLMVCVFITNSMLTPGTKVVKTSITGKITLKNPPTNNGQGLVTYSNVKPDVFNSMKQKLAEAGVQVPQGNEGDIQGYGVKIYFKWDGVTNLTVTIKNKPWYISRETITGKIHDFVLNCGGKII